MQFRSSSGTTHISMMQATHFWDGHYLFSIRRRFDRTWVWAIFVERIVRPALVIVLHIGSQNIPKMLLIHDDHVIETFATNRADDALNVNILPWRLPCGDDLLNP